MTATSRYGLVYSLWRLFADPFHADTLNILTFQTIGFGSANAARLARPGLGKPVAIARRDLFTVAGGLAVARGQCPAQLDRAAARRRACLAPGPIRAERAGQHGAGRGVRRGPLRALMARVRCSPPIRMAWFDDPVQGIPALCWLWQTGQHCAAQGAWRLVRRHITLLRGDRIDVLPSASSPS